MFPVTNAFHIKMILQSSWRCLNDHFSGPKGAQTQYSCHHVDDSYRVREKPMGTAKPVRIVCIGAGASGLNMIRTVRLNLTNYDLVVYEKNEEVGGTWFENRYPGCRCDIPSHNYQFSWRPKHDWSSLHAPAEEIGDYLRTVCDEEGMRNFIKLQHQIVSAQWNEEKGLWELLVKDLRTGKEFVDHANFLLDASGVLNNWKWPDLPGIDTFKGTVIHTARWPKQFEHAGKTMVLIGNGATGIQLLPELQAGAKKVHHMVRTPTWVSPPRLQVWKMMGQAQGVMNSIDLDAQENFSPQTIDRFKADPAFYRSFVKGVEKELNAFDIVLKDGPLQKLARGKLAEYMAAMLGANEKLCKALIPDYPVWTRRMTLGHGYLTAVTQPNVEVRREGIKRFLPEGIELDSGEILEADAIVCATGFETSFCPRFPLLGREENLQDTWAEGAVPKAYMSCAVAGLPNYFSFFGPNGPIGHGSVFTLTEHIAKYITGIIRKCQTEGIKAIAPTSSAVDDYFEHITAFMPRTAWAGSGRSWFKGGREDGPVTALHPGSRVHFFHMLERFRGEDWEYTYDSSRQNRFGYLGNGFSTRELDPDADVTWYLDASTVLP